MLPNAASSTSAATRWTGLRQLRPALTLGGSFSYASRNRELLPHYVRLMRTRRRAARPRAPITMKAWSTTLRRVAACPTISDSSRAGLLRFFEFRSRHTDPSSEQGRQPSTARHRPRDALRAVGGAQASPCGLVSDWRDDTSAATAMCLMYRLRATRADPLRSFIFTSVGQ